MIIFTVICKTITFKTNNKLHTIQGEMQIWLQDPPQ